MIAVNLSHDLDKVRRQLRGVQKEAVPKAAVSALNKTAAKVKGQSIKDVSKATGIKQKIIKYRFSFTLRGKATRRTMATLIRAFYHEVPVMALGKPKQTRRGVQVARAVYPGSFLTTMPSGKRSVWKRRGRKRTPIDKVKLQINPPADNVVKRTTRRVVANDWPKLFGYEINRRLKARLR